MCTTLRPTNSWENLPLIDELYFCDPANDYVSDFGADFGFSNKPANMGPSVALKQEQGNSPQYFDSYNSQSWVSSNTSGFTSPATSSTPDSSISQKPVSKDALRKKQQRDEDAPTTCSICACPASCYHYQAAACNGCKTFFRRSIVLRKKYVCKFDSNCDILGGARCRACRYDRCLLAGMDASAIKFSDSETATAVMNEVNKRKRALKSTADESEQKDALAVQVKIIPKFDQTSDSRTVDFLAYLEMKFRRLRESVFNDRDYYELDISDILKRRTELGNADKYEKPVWPTFEELRKDPFTASNGRHWLACDVLLNIEYLKAMPFFHDLDLKDQEALSMHVVLVNTTLVQSWYSFKQNSQILVHPDGFGPLHMRKFAPISKLYPEIIPIELENFARSIEPLYRIRLEDEEYFLLKAIIFCHSDTPGLSEHAQEILDKYRELYSSTLLRRMQARLGTLAGARKFTELIGLIQTFFHFAQKKRELHFFIETLHSMMQRRKQPLILEWFIKNSSRF